MDFHRNLIVLHEYEFIRQIDKYYLRYDIEINKKKIINKFIPVICEQISLYEKKDISIAE